MMVAPTSRNLLDNQIDSICWKKRICALSKPTKTTRTEYEITIEKLRDQVELYFQVQVGKPSKSRRNKRTPSLPPSFEDFEEINAFSINKASIEVMSYFSDVGIPLESWSEFKVTFPEPIPLSESIMCTVFAKRKLDGRMANLCSLVVHDWDDFEESEDDSMEIEMGACDIDFQVAPSALSHIADFGCEYLTCSAVKRTEKGSVDYFATKAALSLSVGCGDFMHGPQASGLIELDLLLKSLEWI